MYNLFSYGTRKGCDATIYSRKHFSIIEWE